MASLTPQPLPLNIAIIGASISGLALAIALENTLYTESTPNATHSPSLSYTLYESSSSFNTIGAGIAFGPNALRAMELISPDLRTRYEEIASGNEDPGKERVFCEMLLCEPGLGLTTPGKLTSFAVLGESGAEIRYGCFRKSSAHRKVLLEIMKDLVPAERVRLGKRAVGIKQMVSNDHSKDKARVQIVFADGSVVEADAVIGCDGGKGITRNALLSGQYPEHVNATYAGRYVYRAIVPMEDARQILGELAGDGKIFVGEGRYFATYQMSGGTQLNLLAGRQHDGPWKHEGWTTEVSREEMLEDFRGCDGRLVKLLEYAKPTRWSLHHHLSTPIYYSNLICLIGDAAHASTPHQGAGAGQCLEDALLLSHLLSLASRQEDPLRRPPHADQSLPQGPYDLAQDSHNPHQPHPHHPYHDPRQLIRLAFSTYDTIRRPRAQETVRTSDEAGKMYCFQDPDCRHDIEKIVQNARSRFRWIWEHDISADLRRAEEEFWRGARISREGNS